MSRHHTEDIEAPAETLDGKGAPGRYRAEVGTLRFGRCEVQLVTTHVLRVVGEHGEPVDPVETETRLDAPPVVLGQRWAAWKARRMVAAAHRKDIREQQPWA